MRRRLARALRCRRLLLILLLAASSGCINGSPDSPITGTPTTPTTPAPAPTLTAVTVTGLSGAATPGQSAQLTASANYSDGSAATVTQQASWASANPAVATVSGAGLVTFVALGEADIRATFQSLTGTVRVTVTAAPVRRFALTGLLTDADNRRGVEGVRVDVADGADAGRSTTTAADGTFTLPGLAEGTFGLRLTHPYYEVALLPVTLTAPTRLEVALRPIVNVSALFGTYNVSLRVTQQTCESPITPASSGQLTLSGNADGTAFRAVLVERGTTRVYSGSMRADGSFSGSGGGLIAGVTGPIVINKHDYTGGIQGRVTGNGISGTETVNFTVPCPGRILEIAFSGSR